VSTHETFETVTQQPAPGFLAEFWMFLANNKKWWLLPIIVVILLLGLLVFLSSTPLAPFVYTLF